VVGIAAVGILAAMRERIGFEMPSPEDRCCDLGVAAALHQPEVTSTGI